MMYLALSYDHRLVDGADAALFEIDGTELFLKAGTSLDFESDASLDVTVVVDDAWQGVDHIVRGADLLEVTCLHLYLYRLLGLQPPRYLHIPLMKNADGKKLSKQTGAEGLDIPRASALLLQALEFLGQQVDPVLAQAKPAEVLAYAVERWDSNRISRS